jgi:hypothetical protein
MPSAGLYWHHDRAASGAPAPVQIPGRHTGHRLVLARGSGVRGDELGSGRTPRRCLTGPGCRRMRSSLGLAALFRTSARPENAVRVRYLFDNGLQTKADVEFDLSQVESNHRSQHYQGNGHPNHDQPRRKNLPAEPELDYSPRELTAPGAPGAVASKTC